MLQLSEDHKEAKLLEELILKVNKIASDIHFRFRMGSVDCEAADVAQHALVAAWRFYLRKEKLVSMDDLLKYATMCVRNYCIDRQRTTDFRTNRLKVYTEGFVTNTSVDGHIPINDICFQNWIKLQCEELQTMIYLLIDGYTKQEVMFILDLELDGYNVRLSKLRRLYLEYREGG